MTQERFNDVLAILGWSVQRISTMLMVDVSVIRSMKTGRRRVPNNLGEFLEGKVLGTVTDRLPKNWNPEHFNKMANKPIRAGV